jgi:hypothetical protein
MPRRRTIDEVSRAKAGSYDRKNIIAKIEINLLSMRCRRSPTAHKLTSTTAIDPSRMLILIVSFFEKMSLRL